ncbi:hypothetical protein B0H13DRAFT_2359916 [Mycena leptocephala]|nr:hypothetical protein B0H13DRAFT_2359916 [Mycena leptocephala]
MSITLCALALDPTRPPEVIIFMTRSGALGAAYDIYLGPLLHGPLNNFAFYCTVHGIGHQWIVDVISTLCVYPLDRKRLLSSIEFNRTSPTLANPPLIASDVGGPAVHEAGVHKKPALGILPARYYPKPTIPRTQYVFATPPSLFFHPPPWFSLSFFLQHLLILDSLALVQDFSRTCQFDLCLSTHPPPLPCCPPTISGPPTTFLECSSSFSHPTWTSQCSDHSHDPKRPMNNTAHISARDKFLDVRSVHPYAKEGPGSCYNIACVNNADIALYRAGASPAPISWRR